jgi:hypothetical protein
MKRAIDVFVVGLLLGWRFYGLFFVVLGVCFVVGVEVWFAM